MNQFTLLRSAHFNKTQCDFWSSEGEEIFLTSEQLGQALGYLNPRVSISNLVNRHPYLKSKEFSDFINVVTPGGKQQTRVFSEDGIYEVTFLANTERAVEFRSWLRKILRGLRKGVLQVNQLEGQAVPKIVEEVKVLKDSVERTQQHIQILSHQVDQQMTIDYGKQSKVQFAIKSRVLALLGGKESVNYEVHRHKYFAAIYSDMKKKMGVCSYKDIRVKDYEEALHYIKQWQPEFQIQTA